MTAAMSPQERSAHLAFALLEIAEATHALYMARELITRAKRGEVYSPREAEAYITRAADKSASACDSYALAEEGQS